MALVWGPGGSRRDSGPPTVAVMLDAVGHMVDFLNLPQLSGRGMRPGSTQVSPAYCFFPSLACSLHPPPRTQCLSARVPCPVLFCPTRFSPCCQSPRRSPSPSFPLLSPSFILPWLPEHPLPADSTADALAHPPSLTPSPVLNSPRVCVIPNLTPSLRLSFRRVSHCPSMSCLATGFRTEPSSIRHRSFLRGLTGFAEFEAISLLMNRTPRCATRGGFSQIPRRRETPTA